MSPRSPLPGDEPGRPRTGAARARARTRSAAARPAGPPRHEARRRTFPQFAPREAPDGRFAASWWGNAWVDALEDTALDPARLARGKAYAQRGHVDAITVAPGRVVAYVHGSRPRPYRAEIRLRTLGDDDWERFLDEAAARPEHIAALLDKDVPHALEAVTGLLPAPGDLVPDCTCPDDGYPCKHAAALCYQAARLLDEDPFVLFLMRGRDEQELLADLTRRKAVHAAAESTPAAPALPTVLARTVLAPTTGHAPPQLPPPFPAPDRPGRPAVFPADPEAPDPLALDLLAGEAAARAHTFLATGHDPVAALTPWQDAVRLAAAHPGSGLTASTRALYRDLAYALDRTPTDLARAVAAWRQGGAAGLAVLEEAWDPPAGPFDRARPALLAADLPAFRPWRNRLSTGSLQLRLGRDGLWYGYESDTDREDWWPRGTPDADPVGVITDLLGW
ncbi:SWIM zinc finger family protein [Streptomyces sp. NPDC051909]|uniref:SWIM zinc finger family protein n=1 Tax=Streptomyces sp. NPDC051909 TaxID=3154944 RepID=UPI003421E7EA